MKKIHFSHLSIPFACFSIFFFSSCEPTVDAEVGDPIVLDTNLLKSHSLFNSGMEERSRTQANVFEIVEVVREDNELRISLKGGNEVDDFQVIWDGKILLTYPGIINFLVVYNGQDINFDPNSEFVISVNLDKVTPEYGDSHQFIVNVLNGSKIAKTVLDPNGTSTHE
ncbi:hypothetical protein [Algoriphagus terrigena]|uniref:hypothetical protein n=1 Tax=Algoriphagus terrigena TaxID=344884 RepID=UPI00047CCA8F|nr:hypothetical protein [Algoriphagus terrigena]